MYSLVNMPTMVRDLARLETRRPVTIDLLRAFALDEAALRSLDATSVDVDPVVRAHVLAVESSRPRALRVLAATRDFATDLGINAYAAALPALEAAPVFGAAELVRFTRRDVLDPAWDGVGELAVARFPRALDAVADGLAASWTDDRSLGRAWRHWVGVNAAPLAAPCRPDVLDVVRRLDARAPLPPVDAQWATHVHEACWALHLTGRLRDAAVVQLHALLALIDTHAPARPPLRSVATVVAAVHAMLVEDVLDTRMYTALTQPLFRFVS